MHVTRGDQKVLGLTYSSVQNKIKIESASYGIARLRTPHAQFDFWAINILCILAVVGCLHSTWKKRSYPVSVYEMTLFWLIRSFRWAFAVAGARLWNSLPHDIVASDTLAYHISVVDSKHFYLDSHILLFCFSSLPCGLCDFYLGHVKKFLYNVL